MHGGRVIRYFPHSCPHCGEREYLELLEAWPSGEFLFTACCETTYEIALEELQQDPEYRAWLMRELGVDQVFGAKLRRVPACDDGVFRLDFNPEIKPIERDQARAFVDEHHAHNKAPVSWRYGAGIWNGKQLIGVIMVGRPVARMIDASDDVEVNRLCLRRDVAARAALERLQPGVRLGRARGEAARLREDHHIHARERAGHDAEGGRLDRRGAHEGRHVEPAEPRPRRRCADHAEDPLGADPGDRAGGDRAEGRLEKKKPRAEAGLLGASVEEGSRRPASYQKALISDSEKTV
jgi:hypothetical protein